MEKEGRDGIVNEFPDRFQRGQWVWTWVKREPLQSLTNPFFLPSNKRQDRWFPSLTTSIIIITMESSQNIQMWGKGSGSSGILNKTATDQPNFVPIQLGHVSPLIKLEMTSSFLLLLTQKKEAFLWGLLDTKKIPRPIKILQEVRQVSCGWDHALLTTPNRLFGFGNNIYLQLGFSSPEKYHPELVPIMMEEPLFIAAGFRQSYCIVNNSLRGCGESKKNELGKASKKLLNWQTIHESLSAIQGKIVQISCGKRFLLMLTDINDLYAFGCNEQSCFNIKNSFFDKPTLIFTKVRQFVCGWAHITILKLDGSVQSYGRNNLGQLGHTKETSLIEFQLEEGERIESLTSGSEFTFAVTTHQRLYGWGWNEHYNILTSQQKIIPKPTLVPVPAKCKQVSTNPALTVIQTSL